jgi:hypothetical protein
MVAGTVADPVIAPLMPLTMLQFAPGGAFSKRGCIDPVDHAHLLAIDLHALHQGGVTVAWSAAGVDVVAAATTAATACNGVTPRRWGGLRYARQN